MPSTTGYKAEILILFLAGCLVPVGFGQDQIDELHLSFQAAAKRAISQLVDLEQKYRARLETLNASTPERRNLLEAEIRFPGSQDSGQWKEFAEVQAIFHGATKAIRPKAFAAKKQLIAQAEAQLDRLISLETPDRSRRLAEESRKLNRVLSVPELHEFLAERRSGVAGVLRGKGTSYPKPIDLSAIPDEARFVRIDVSFEGNWIAQAKDGRVFGATGNRQTRGPGEHVGMRGYRLLVAVDDLSVAAFGINSSGKLDVKPGRSQILSSGIREFHFGGPRSAAALAADGKAIIFSATDRTRVEVLENVTAIGCGELTAAAVTSDGKVHVWGNSYQLDDMKEKARVIGNAIDLSSGRGFHVILRRDGTVATLGEADFSGNGNLRFVRLEAGMDIAVGEAVGGGWYFLGSGGKEKIDWLPEETLSLGVTKYRGEDCWIWIEPD